MRISALILSTTVLALTATAASAQHTVVDPAANHAVDAVDTDAPSAKDGANLVSYIEYAQYSTHAMATLRMMQDAVPPSGAGHDQPEALQAVEPEPSGPTITVYGNVASGRVFQDQAFDLTDRSVVEGGITACSTNGSACIDFWTAQSLVGRYEDHEYDIAIWKDFTASDFTIQAKGGFYELPGKEVWDAKLTVSRPLNQTCGIAGSYELMRGGFIDNVVHGEVACSIDVAPKVSLDGTLGASHTTSSDVVSFGYEFGAGYAVSDTTSVRAFVKGFTSSIDSAAIFGIGFSRTFSF